MEPSTTESGIAAVRAARAELDAVIREIREVPGFEQFLAPPTFSDISIAAERVPIVYLAAADSGGLGLVVRGDDVTHIALDSLTADILRARAQEHLDAYTHYRSDPDRHLPAWSDALLALTGWLWEMVMGPVLTELDNATEAVIVAGGLLGVLPLHVAWIPDTSTPTGRRHAMDQVILSYAPNARALSAARTLAAATTTAGRLLSVLDPSNVSGSELPFAKEEVAGFAAGAGFTSSDRTELSLGRATPNNVRHAAERASVLHLACHGFADLASPLDSGLLLAGDRKLLLRDLMEMNIHSRLAVLSACETALPGTDLPDEVIGLPTGLLQAGVAGVIASQWSVPDAPTAMLMTEFALRWRRGEVSPAAALSGAQQWLRDSTTEQKRQHWKSLRQDLPASVIDSFLNGLVGLEGDRRGHEGLHNWAAFAHLGA